MWRVTVSTLIGKRIYIFILALVILSALLFSLAGCGKEEKKVASKKVPLTAAEAGIATADSSSCVQCHGNPEAIEATETKLVVNTDAPKTEHG